MPSEILEISQKFMRNPIKLLVRNEELTLEGIKQFYVNVEDEKYKYETLTDLYSTITIAQVREQTQNIGNDIKMTAL